MLSRLINPNQTGGLHHRNINNNLCNIRNTIIQGQKSKAVIISLDFAKAFDRADKELPYKTMSLYNFPEAIIHWLKILYGDSLLKAIWGFTANIERQNGKRNVINVMKRGIKQGCPLAMYLYLINIEPLLLKIERSIAGIK